MLKLNNLSVRFLRVCGKSLAEIIAKIVTACFILKYFLQHFCCAEIVMLTKSEKTDKIIHILKVYRFIALLSAINKIIKKIISNKIIAVIKKYNLLSQNQMRNCLDHLIKLIIQMIINAVYTA